jgi:hypothetical protein
LIVFGSRLHATVHSTAARLPTAHAIAELYQFGLFAAAHPEHKKEAAPDDGDARGPVPLPIDLK